MTPFGEALINLFDDDLADMLVIATYANGDTGVVCTDNITQREAMREELLDVLETLDADEGTRH